VQSVVCVGDVLNTIKIINHQLVLDR
jgi:hypothetical protein